MERGHTLSAIGKSERIGTSDYKYQTQNTKHKTQHESVPTTKDMCTKLCVYVRVHVHARVSVYIRLCT